MAWRSRHHTKTSLHTSKSRKSLNLCELIHLLDPFVQSFMWTNWFIRSIRWVSSCTEGIKALLLRHFFWLERQCLRRSWHCGGRSRHCGSRIFFSTAAAALQQPQFFFSTFTFEGCIVNFFKFSITTSCCAAFELRHLKLGTVVFCGDPQLAMKLRN